VKVIRKKCCEESTCTEVKDIKTGTVFSGYFSGRPDFIGVFIRGQSGNVTRLSGTGNLDGRVYDNGHVYDTTNSYYSKIYGYKEEDACICINE